jgi:hypothetical protein
VTIFSSSLKTSQEYQLYWKCSNVFKKQNFCLSMAWRGIMLMALSAALVDSLVQQPQRRAPLRTTEDLPIESRFSSHRHLLPKFLPLRGGAPTTGKREMKKGAS